MTGEQRIAVVTGGARGIGRAISTALREAGCHVVAFGRQQPAQDGSEDLQFLQCDVADADSVVQAFARIREQHGRIDILVNNAGIAGGDRLGDPRDPLWAPMIETNLTGAWRCTQAAVDLFPSHGGRVLFISSVLGVRAVPDQLAYTASKHGVIGLAKSFALALAPRGVTSNAICPGWVDTDMARSRYAELGIDEAQARAGVPTRAVLTPQEVAAAVVYLCSDAARNITGHALVMDGGASV